MDIRIIEYLTSRICHDLISPVGAIHNGIEFMQDMGADGIEDAIDLLAHSSDQASARLQLFRLVYGAGVRSTAIEPRDVYQAMDQYIKSDGKVRQIWDPADEQFVNGKDSGFYKMLLAILLIAHESLPKGGTIEIENQGDKTLVTAKGENAQTRPETSSALLGELSLDELDPRLVHAYVTGLMGKSYHYTVEVYAEEEGKVSLSLSQAE